MIFNDSPEYLERKNTPFTPPDVCGIDLLLESMMLVIFINVINDAFIGRPLTDTCSYSAGGVSKIDMERTVLCVLSFGLSVAAVLSCRAYQ